MKNTEYKCPGCGCPTIEKNDIVLLCDDCTDIKMSFNCNDNGGLNKMKIIDNGELRNAQIMIKNRDIKINELVEALKHLIACADCNAPELPEALENARQALLKAEA